MGEVWPPGPGGSLAQLNKKVSKVLFELFVMKGTERGL